MASDKRSLYHLAPTQIPSPHHRKPLVQGRLETELSPVCRTSFESHDVSKRYSPDEHQPNAGLATTTGQKIRHDDTLARNAEITAEQDNPRMNPPLQYTEPGHKIPALSPQAVEPSSSLSLSENDDSNASLKDQLPYSSNDRQHCQTEELMGTEVPLETSITKSPIKVTCHSPRRLKHKADEAEEIRGFADKTSKVEVPSVTKVVIEHHKDHDKQPRIPEGSLSEDSLENICMIEGSPVDPSSSAIRVALNENDKENAEQLQVYNHHQYNSFMGDIDSIQGGPLSAVLNQSNVRKQLFDYSASVNSSIAMEDKTDKKKKKKRTTRVIPSRYMDSKKAMPVTAKPPVKKNSSLQTKRKVSFAPKSSKMSASLHDSSHLNTTVPNQNAHGIKGSSKIMTSTPAVGSMGILPGHPGGDLQEPTPILPQKNKSAEPDTHAIKDSGAHYTGLSSKQIAESLAKNREKSKKSVKVKAPLLPQKLTDHITKQKHEYGQGELSQRQLELEYSRLLQWIFLESKLKSTSNQQEKDAQSQLYSMWQENEKLRRDMAKLQLELDEKKMMEELDGQLQLQLSNLKPIGVNIPKLILEYDQLSSALNTTCQYVPVNSVLLPDKHEELLAALSESEQLLGEIVSLTRHWSHKISSFSKEMDVLAKLTETDVQEQGRCQELLAAASTLGTQERSLKAHMIQQTSPSIHDVDEYGSL